MTVVPIENAAGARRRLSISTKLRFFIIALAPFR
jgi:hypothetical protein